MKQSTNPWDIALGLLFGGLVAGAYLFVKVRGQHGGLPLFGLTAACVFAGHLILWPRITIQGFFDRQMCLRGFLYGFTQILIFKAQSHGFTSTAIVATTTGSIFGVLLGRILLRERLQGLALASATLCFTAVLLNPVLILTSYLGLIGGLIQGTGFVMARMLMVSDKSIRQSVACGFGMSTLVSVLALAFGEGLSSIANIGFGDLGITIAIALVAQYGFFYMYKIMDSQRASILALSRIPWAIGLESAILGTPILLPQLIASGLIAVGSVLLIADARIRQAFTTKPQKQVGAEESGDDLEKDNLKHEDLKMIVSQMGASQ